MNFLLLYFFGFLQLPPALSIKMTRKDPLLYFMSTAEDFENDPDVCFMAVKLHTPATVELYYQTAAQTFTDLQQIFAEFAKDREKAAKFLEINQKMFEASFAAPLTVANMIFTIGKQVQPLLEYRCSVIDSLAERTKQLEETGNDTITTINRFFRHFALPEMQFIEILCNLMSQARLLKKPDSRGNILDLKGTGLLRSEKRVLLTLANFIAKADLLLTLFLTEPTAAQRSLNLVRKLWHVHWRRWQLQTKQPFPSEPFYFDAHSYQKEPIHFTFPDWSSEVDVEKEVALLQIRREKLMKKYEAEEAARRLLLRQANPPSKMWIVALVVVFGIVAVALAFAYRVIKRQQEGTETL